jgi:hypothetical protein
MFNRTLDTVNYLARTPTSKVISDLYNDPKDLPRGFKQMLDKIGNEQITKIVIFRKPLQDVMYSLFNLFSLGEIGKRLSRSPYDDLFHLGLLINDRYILEKVQVANLMLNNGSYLKSEGVEFMQIMNVPNITIRDFIMNVYNKVGKLFLLYDSQNNNCQIFVRNLLMHNNILNPQYNNFIMQDVQNIFKNNPFLVGLMKKITDLGNRATYAIGGSLDNTNTLKTTSNNDLQLLANRLKINLNGILMSDEIYQYKDKDMPNGNYILNLEDSNQDGSHWTGMVKNHNIIYYMDSYGAFPDRPLYDIMKIHNYSLIMNEKNHQKLSTQSCGYWVILFLYYMNKKSKKKLVEKFKEFNSLWTEDTALNERLLHEEINKLFKKKTKKIKS